ncbi:MAG TPA: SDR family oxidoreductase [Hypericibacter adhaerens]|uniref:SDR family NAD(P)-dependent oxidoreductase n=1 Tax=Hypericibacter adhaerens TaxID=2602016 RepID=UPI002B63F786|nr:SDR family oxidoreductase [Hypericibacter adhaerens]HWA45529.1 SDR family oxidoreductase [Hypericibacter adhaerens]
MSFVPERFAGRVVIVTGAGSGIGRGVALRMVREGADVLAVDRNPDGLSGLVAAASTGSGKSPIKPLVCDVGAAETPARIVGACQARFGRIDVLVNNAGVGEEAERFTDNDDEAIASMFAVNLLGLIRLTRDCLKVMTRPGGRIVNVSSVFGLVGFPSSALYAATKGGVAQLTRQLAADWTPQGITVNAVAPGVIETAMTKRYIDNSRWYQRAMIETTPAPRVGQPEDIAAAVSFLASPEADFISGVVLPVDGGWLATRYLPPDPA